MTFWGQAGWVKNRVRDHIFEREGEGGPDKRAFAGEEVKGNRPAR